jgi:hypothetical protein
MHLFANLGPVGSRLVPDSAAALWDLVKVLLEVIVVLAKLGLVHRDIRLHNIIYYNGWHLIDWELAGLSGVLIPEYFHHLRHVPELQAKRIETYTHLHDMWQVGACVSMCTGGL